MTIKQDGLDTSVYVDGAEPVQRATLLRLIYLTSHFV
jgi:hypothetical protein